MMSFFKWICILACLSISCGLYAQGSLNGFVKEENKDGGLSPIAFANVYWVGATKGTATDSNGAFSLVQSELTNRLVVSYVGFQSDTLIVEQTDDLTIVLRPLKALKGVDVVYEQRGTEISYMDPMKVQNIGEKELFKAACCNLSESFETNPSVDVGYTDAVTGTKQIHLLGLDGKYSQITREGIPTVRGLSSIQGLTYIPGTWIESIQLNKGAGSVVNGFESITGQINVELKKPESGAPLFINAYANRGGRTELNLLAAHQFNPKLATSILVHGNLRALEVDGNDDGFLDFPLGHQVNVINRWKFNNLKGWEGQIGVRALTESRQGGQVFNQESDSLRVPYGVSWQTNRLEAWVKTGYVFPKAKYHSFGVQAKALNHDQRNVFGDYLYEGLQQSAYVNAIYQGILFNTSHKYKTGVSWQYDRFEETLNDLQFQRTESVPGVFGEYAFNYLDRLAVVAGLRADWHNFYGFFLTPRLHLRYEIREGTVLRASGGRGARTANLIAENLGLLATSRTWIIDGDAGVPGFGVEQEVSWNIGVNLTQDFRLNYRPATLALDAYHTRFENQLVVDLENPREVLFYNLEGESYATSLQAQIDYSPIRKMDVRVAYRWFDVQNQFRSGVKRNPYVAQHRAFTNLGYALKSGWTFDYTFQWQGEKRLPSTAENSELYRRSTSSPHLFLMNAQITKSWHEVFDLYLGMENITNVRQPNPIIASDQPNSPFFDSSMIWGPIFGRMIYVGMRWNPSKAKKAG